ncbi:MAG: NUDIX domain-containing protein [Clostridia bacterium]|nr:NUDIX domain-containing protein [Clostridia bacterium]
MTEKDFIKNYNKNDYDRPSVAVDLLIFTIMDNELKVLMVNRPEHPYKEYLSLPGVFVGIDEDLDSAAKRGLAQKAGLKDIYLEQLYTWGQVDRDPRMRIISISYYALVPAMKITIQNDSNFSPQFYSVDEILDTNIQIAFDHRKIIEYGRERIRNKTDYTDIAFELVPEEFTLPQLQRIYEILLCKKLYKANFRKQISDKVVETGNMTTGDAYRPSKFFKYIANNSKEQER